MNKNQYRVIVVGVIVVAILTYFWVMNIRIAKAPGGAQACTLEAKLCPDGSAVGRTGPKCEFAACPTPGVGATSTTTIAIGGSAIINGTVIGLLELVEDSRCPADVQCIQAGTVRVRVSIDAYNKEFILTLGEPQVVGNVAIMLSSVIPSQKYSKQTVAKGDYRFTFSVATKVIATPTPASVSSSGSGVRGTVLLGPTCPVMRNPPDPQCADKPYATDIQVYRTGSNTVVTNGKSDASGAFEFSLPPGTYKLVAKGGSTLPRCNDASVTVSPHAYVTTTISCDTGIR